MTGMTNDQHSNQLTGKWFHWKIGLPDETTGGMLVFQK